MKVIFHQEDGVMKYALASTPSGVMNEPPLVIATKNLRRRLLFSGFSNQSKQATSVLNARVMGHIVGSWDDAAVASSM